MTSAKKYYKMRLYVPADSLSEYKKTLTTKKRESGPFIYNICVAHSLSVGRLPTGDVGLGAWDRAGWLKLVTKVSFDIGNPQLRPPRCDTRVTPEEKRRFLARRAQETKQRRALFNAETDAEEI